MNKTLTAIAIERLRPPPKGRLEIGDVPVPGLCLRVTENGVKSWSLLYRVVGEGGVNANGRILKGKQRRLTFGVWPNVDLSAARAKARDALQLASEGRDPIALRRTEVSQRICPLTPSFLHLGFVHLVFLVRCSVDQERKHSMRK